MIISNIGMSVFKYCKPGVCYNGGFNIGSKDTETQPDVNCYVGFQFILFFCHDGMAMRW